MAERLRPPSFKEGFSKITVVRVKGLPGNTPAAAPTPESYNEPVPADLDAPEVEASDLDAPESGEDSAS
jgi:hypothetical protein